MNKLNWKRANFKNVLKKALDLHPELKDKKIEISNNLQMQMKYNGDWTNCSY